MWCRPVPSSVSPMYMPGRLRTASSPRSTLIESAPYSSAPGVTSSSLSLMGSWLSAKGGSNRRDRAVGHAQDLRPAAERRKKLGIGAGHPALHAERHHLVEQRRAALRIEMGRDLVE